MELPNRKQRRKWAKDSGFLKKKNTLSLEKQLEISRRAAESGKQIHLRNVERDLQREEDKREEASQKKREVEFFNLIENGHTTEEALSIMKKKYDLDGALDS